MTATPAAAPAATATRTSRTETFICPDCDHTFRRRTKAGIYSTCPKCKGRALAKHQHDRLVAGAARRAEQQAKKSPAAKAKRAPAAAVTTLPATPAAQAKREPARIVTPHPKSSPARPAVTPEPSRGAAPAPAAAPRGGRGFWASLLGTPDDDE